MVPRTGRLTLIGRKLYNVLLHHSQAKLQRGRMPDASDYFEAQLRTLLEPVGVGESDLRALAKRYLVEMQDVTMEWDSPESNAGTEWKRLKLLSEVELVKRGGETWVRWALPPTLVQGLADPLRWTSLELTLLAKLTTYASVALYEICARFKNNPSGVTSRKPTTWWIDALSNSPAAIDPTTGQPKRREWRKFKNEFVLGAIDQINEQTDLDIELLEFKQGRSVAEAQFSVRKKMTRPTLAAKSDAALLDRCSKVGINERELTQLLEAWDPEEITSAIGKLEQRQSMPGLEEIRSPAGYLRHLLTKPEEPKAAEQTRATSNVRSILNVDQNTTGESTKRKELAMAIAELPPDAQRSLLREVADSLRERGLFTPSVARRAGQGDWQASGLLKSGMVELYAKRLYGEDWKIEINQPSPKADENAPIA